MSQNSNRNNRSNYRKGYSQRKENAPRSGFRKGSRSDYNKNRHQRYNTDSLVARISNPKRDETIEDIIMDIEKLEKDIQFEIKQIRSVKLGL
jgi:hypothetical protein